jgi:hypothetical protein
MVVQELNPDLVIPVALYYLVLRGLDTIEDDMTISLEEKEPLPYCATSRRFLIRMAGLTTGMDLTRRIESFSYISTT